MEHGRINLFYSYAHEDEAACRQVMEALGALQAEGVIDEWYDRRISPGTQWRSEISDNLERAHIVLLMISPDFLASEYCMGVELRQALDRHWLQRCRIVPVVLRECRWAGTQFGSFQALPRDGKAIEDWRDAGAALDSVAEGVRSVCRAIVDWGNPYRRAAIGDWTETEQTCLVKQTGQPSTVRVVLRVLAKSRKRNSVTVGFTARRNGRIVPLSEFQPAGFVGGTYRMGTDRLQFPLDAPLEDQLGRLMQQLGQSLPRNAEIDRKETGRGEQKLNIGGRTYHCHWMGYEVAVAQGFEQAVYSGRTWRCLDVPLDGIVRSESETPLVRVKSVLLDYGHGAARG